MFLLNKFELKFSKGSIVTPFKESFILKILLAIAVFFYSLMTSAQVEEIPKCKD